MSDNEKEMCYLLINAADIAQKAGDTHKALSLVNKVESLINKYLYPVKTVEN